MQPPNRHHGITGDNNIEVDIHIISRTPIHQWEQEAVYLLHAELPLSGVAAALVESPKQ